MEGVWHALAGFFGAIGALIASLFSPLFLLPSPPPHTSPPALHADFPQRSTPTPPHLGSPSVRSVPSPSAQQSSALPPTPSFPPRPLNEAQQRSPTHTTPTAHTPPTPTTPTPHTSSPTSPLPPPPPPPPLPLNTSSSPHTAERSWRSVDALARSALVNIRCMRRETTPERIRLTQFTGSGVLIDSRGIILTSAHIVYPLTLPQSDVAEVRCEVRTGAPARVVGEATLLYLPLAWAQANAAILTAPDGYTSTGEHDYALVWLQLPTSTLPVATWSTAIPTKGEQVLAAAYPAEFYDPETVERSFYPLTTIGKVGDLFAFASEPGQPAMFSLPGVVLAQRGASGGGVFRSSGELVGLITTGDIAASSTGERTLYVLTLRAIDASLRSATGLSLSSFLASDLNERHRWFHTALLPRIQQVFSSQAAR